MGLYPVVQRGAGLAIEQGQCFALALAILTVTPGDPQAAFSAVFNTTTKSDNKLWLQRRLAEGAGGKPSAAPASPSRGHVPPRPPLNTHALPLSASVQRWASCRATTSPSQPAHGTMQSLPRQGRPRQQR